MPMSEKKYLNKSVPMVFRRKKKDSEKDERNSMYINGG